MSLDITAWLRYPKIDMHSHAWNLGDAVDEATSCEQLIRAGEMLGIREFWCSSPITGGRIATSAEPQQERPYQLSTWATPP